MRDGKALQMGTSHELGQRFSRAFDIGYLSADGARELCWTTSWGSSTRMLGGLIMCHGDDFGLVLPPALAPIQAVVVVVKDTDGDVIRAASALVDDLKRRGVRTLLDDDVDHRFGWRATDWDLQGVPIRVEIGPRIWPATPPCCTGATPATRPRWRWTAVVDEVQLLTHHMQTDMLDAATARRDAFISDCTTSTGARCRHRRVSRACRGRRSVSPENSASPPDGLTVRCLQRDDGALPDTDDDAGTIAYVARAY